MLKILDKYILKEVFPPFLVGLLVTAFALLMNQVLLLAELFIDRGVPVGVAARLFVYLVPSLLAFAVPMAVLTGILGGLARLSADSEIVAFRSLGIGAGRIARPLVLFGLAGWLVTSALTLVLAPRANFLWVREMTSSVLARASLRINPLEFSETIPKTVLFIENVDQNKQWQNVFAYLNKDPHTPRVVMARTGRIHFFPGDKRATLELEDGVLHSGTLAKPETYSVTSFERFEEEIDVESLFPTVAREKRVREKDILELVRDAKGLGGEVAALNASGQADAPSTRALAIRKRRDLRTHWVEIHKKFSLPFVCFVFVLLGLPLGLMTGRGGRTGGLSLSLAIIFLYYVLITAGEKLAIDGRITPFLAMWGPDILLTAAGLVLFFRSERDTDALARLTVSLRKRIAALFRFRPRPRARRGFRPPFGLPGILDRYIARKYLAIMAFATTALLGAYVIVAFFERLDEVHRHGQPVGLLVHHIWFRLPEFLSSVLPAAALTTTLLVLGLLVRTNEVTAMKASGISLYRMIVPVLLLSAAASGAAGLIQERLAPAAGIRAEEIWNRINGLPARRYSAVGRHWILGRQKDRIYHYDYFDPVSATFSHLSVFDIETGRWILARRAYAEKASLGPDGLDLRRGWLRDFTGGAAVPFAVQESWRLAAADGRSSFIRDTKEPEQMTYGELRDYAAEVRAAGFQATRLVVDLRGKIAFPLASLVMTLIAVPFALSMGRKGALVGVGLSIVLAGGYWGAFALFRSFGYTAVLTPFLAAWGANLVFGLTGLFLLFRLRT